MDKRTYSFFNIRFLLLLSTFLFLSIYCVISWSTFSKSSFNSIDEVKQYTKSYNELVKMENNNLGLPKYDSYLEQKHNSGITWLMKHLSKLLSSFGIKSFPQFIETYFKDLLIELSNSRSKKDSAARTFIKKISLDSKSKVVVFGPIQGAFHSLVRYIETLVIEGIIDKQFRVKNKHYHIVILGNLVNRSPFILETLLLILVLLKKNPENVHYLRGSNEYFEGWNQGTLRKELEIRCKFLSDLDIPLKNLLNNFFDTLPEALVALENQSNKSYFLFMPHIFSLKLPSSLNGKILDSGTNRLKNNEIYGKKINAIIRDIRKRDDYEKTDGLRLLEPMGSAVAWNVMSCPTESYRKAFGFSFDAFVILVKDLPSEKWLLKLYNRDINNTDKKIRLRRVQGLIDGATY